MYLKSLLLSLLLCLTSFAGVLEPPRGMVLNHGYLKSRVLVGYWPFNEGSGNKAFDLSGNGYTGTITTPTWSAGKFGWALDTTILNHHVDTNTDDPFDLPELTVLAWVNTSTVNSGQVRDDLVSKEGDNAGWILRFDETTDKFEMVARDGGSWRVATGAIARTANTWYQVVGRYSAASTDIIVNAKLDATTTGVAAYAASATDVWIGANPFTDDKREFNGLIDHVIIWNRFLSLSEIALLYREQFCMFAPTNPLVFMSGTGAPAVSIPVMYYHYVFHSKAYLFLPLIPFGLYFLRRRKCAA